MARRSMTAGSSIPSAWRGIETAPKDGSDLWLWDPKFRRAKVGSWREDGMMAERGEMWLDDSYDDFSCGLESCPLEPTHWMPLPSDPALENSESASQGDDGQWLGWQLEVVARCVEGWVEWDETHRQHEGMTTEDGTHITALPVPCWPTHGQFRNWVGLFREAAQAIDARSDETGSEADGFGPKGESAVAESDAP